MKFVLQLQQIVSQRRAPFGMCVDQFAELGYAGRARELALRLMSQGQGISVMAHVHNDPGLLRREKEHLDRWLDQLADGNDACA